MIAQTKRLRVVSADDHAATVQDVLLDLLRNPYRNLILRWNWKSAVCSSLIRAAIFFSANLSAGWRAATGAMATEFLYRALSSGFFGALTQAFRRAEPAWLAFLAAAILLPVSSHSIELCVHLLRGTPKLAASMIASICFTAISTSFNVYAMRRGVLIVGSDARSLAGDVRRLPRIIGGFLASGPITLYRALS